MVLFVLLVRLRVNTCHLLEPDRLLACASYCLLPAVGMSPKLPLGFVDPRKPALKRGFWTPVGRGIPYANESSSHACFTPSLKLCDKSGSGASRKNVLIGQHTLSNKKL